MESASGAVACRWVMPVAGPMVGGGSVMILEILFVVVMFLWLLTILPFPAVAPYHGTNVFFAYVAVLLLGLYLFLPAFR